MFHQMGFKNTDRNPVFNHGVEATVFNIAQHASEPVTLYALVHDDGRQCLISERGVVLVEEPETVNDSVQIDRIIDRLTQIESKLDQLAKHTMKPEKRQTAVEWLSDQLASYDYDSGETNYEILIPSSKFQELKATALEMEQKQNCK
jgi:stress-induced morphogen